MKILYVSGEAAPFSASGGLGDVMGSLPRAVGALGNECSVITPLYRSVRERYGDRLLLVTSFFFNLSWRKTGASVYTYNKVKSEEDRQSFLAQFGWEVSSAPTETREVTIPSEFDKVFAAYNELQKEQGFDLSKYRKKTATRKRRPLCPEIRTSVVFPIGKHTVGRHVKT